jgi:DNA-binding HxlR family transcriptional regulator
MNEREKALLKLLINDYSREMLRFLEEPRRFKDLSAVCRVEKTRSERLREFERFNLIKVKPTRVGRRPVSIYRISETGRKALKLSDEIDRQIKAI